MTPSLPRVLLMCLALAFASVWLGGCGPDVADGVDATDAELLPPDPSELDHLPCACGEESD
jgi:hypothetical protein